MNTVFAEEIMRWEKTEKYFPMFPGQFLVTPHEILHTVEDGWGDYLVKRFRPHVDRDDAMALLEAWAAQKPSVLSWGILRRTGIYKDGDDTQDFRYLVSLYSEIGGYKCWSAERMKLPRAIVEAIWKHNE